MLAIAAAFEGVSFMKGALLGQYGGLLHKYVKHASTETHVDYLSSGLEANTDVLLALNWYQMYDWW